MNDIFSDEVKFHNKGIVNMHNLQYYGKENTRVVGQLMFAEELLKKI